MTPSPGRVNVRRMAATEGMIAGAGSRELKVHRPVVSTLEPGLDDLIVMRIALGIAVNAVVCGGPKSGNHRFGCSEIHIGRPKRYQVLAFDARGELIPLIGPLRRSELAAIMDNVKVKAFVAGFSLTGTPCIKWVICRIPGNLIA